jgi:transcriptional antiterminator Rof (Rho-off)
MNTHKKITITLHPRELQCLHRLLLEEEMETGVKWSMNQLIRSLLIPLIKVSDEWLMEDE